MDYLIVVQGPAYFLSTTSFAVESAFAEHLIALRKGAGQRFNQIVLVAPQLSDKTFEERKHYLRVINSVEDGVSFVPAYPAFTSTKKFWFRYIPHLFRILRRCIQKASVVHVDLSTDIRRPFTAVAYFLAWRMNRPIVFVVDIDFRKHTKRLWKLGGIGIFKYLFNKYVQDVFKWLQVWLAVRFFQLVLIKSESMARDFGGGRPHVKNFYDTVHSTESLLSDDQMRCRLTWIAERSNTLKLCYFGRLVDYKGVDRIIQAIRIASASCDVTLLIIGDGPNRILLGQQVHEQGLDDRVTFVPQLAYGEALFDALLNAHATIAAPLIEDTPRAAFDSMARGLPIIAFDISYFRDLSDASEAIMLASWPQASALSEKILAINKDRDALAAMAIRGLEFARVNTQESWLDLRLHWTVQFALGK
jgi:glycosyltransferase involved in cell wall biosynthesis